MRKRKHLSYKDLGTRIQIPGKETEISLEVVKDNLGDIKPGEFRVVEYEKSSGIWSIGSIAESTKEYIEKHVDKEFGLLISLPNLAICNECCDPIDLDHTPRVADDTEWFGKYCSSTCHYVNDKRGN